MKMLNQQRLSFYQKVMMGISSFIAPMIALAEEDPTKKLGGITKGNVQTDFYDLITVNSVLSGKILLVAVSAISFIWISYTAIAKFRECQKGMADWSELMVLGVAAGAILVFTSYVLTGAGNMLDPL